MNISTIIEWSQSPDIRFQDWNTHLFIFSQHWHKESMVDAIILKYTQNYISNILVTVLTKVQYLFPHRIRQLPDPTQPSLHLTTLYLQTLNKQELQMVSKWNHQISHALNNFHQVLEF